MTVILTQLYTESLLNTTFNSICMNRYFPASLAEQKTAGEC